MQAVSIRPRPHGAARYEIERELARGGMGVVYRARDRSTGTEIALKRTLVDEVGQTELPRSMLQREYQTLAALNHPHIIRVYDFGVDEVGPYYTMELLEGADLRSKCPLPWRDVCGYLRDVASSLALLHSRRLIHCDVSVSNIWLTREGRAKLLDFGALANFGRNTIVAGSPPTTAPEMLAGQELDQRVDLYALGASAYFALTGRHAYPATMLALLPALWSEGRPAPPSAYVSDIPKELDELVLGLIEQDRMLRPSSAAEVIDRLEVIAGLTPDRDPRVLRSYLQSTVMVGRDAQQRMLADKLKHALKGHATGALIEGTVGLGKSLLLADLEQRARMTGARVITVHARAHAGALGVWSAILREAHPSSASAGRASVTADSNVLMELAASTPLVLAIEDLQEADTESLAALLTLAKFSRRAQLMIAATLDPSHPRAARPAIQLLRSRLTLVELKPFDDKVTHSLVVGMFGDVPQASRLSGFLHDHAAGNPQTCRTIIDHLIDQEFIRYAEGIWLLPAELPEVGAGGLDLGALVKAALESRIAHWSEPLRRLAACLSPTRSPLDFALCEAVAKADPALAGENLAQRLAELVHEGALIDDHGSYTFARVSEQEFFYAQLDEARKRRQHLAFGNELERRAATDLTRTFEAGFHFLLAGEPKKATRHLNDNVEQSLGKLDIFIQAVPELWALLRHQRAAGATDEEVQFIEGVLVLAAYYVDPTIYDAFGERALRLMHRTLGFALASRLAPWIGAHLALTVGLLVGWVRSRLRKPYLLSGGKFSVAVLTFVGVCVSMNVGSCSRGETKGLALLFELLDVTRKLGRLNVLRYLYDQFKMGEEFAQGRIARGRRELFDQLERLPKLPGITQDAHHQFEAGLLFSLALNSLLGTGREVPDLIARIEALGSKYDLMQAQFLRYQYHLYRGDLPAAKREEERYDEMSAQSGSRWNADIHAALAFAPLHLTADVLGLKRAVHRLERLLTFAPKLDGAHAVARAMYEGHRGRPDLALRIYEKLGERIAPFQESFWSVALGHKAECLNTLGRHAEALSLCERAREPLSEEDRSFLYSYQQLERESALALAGLGRVEEATALADKLLAEAAHGENLLIRGLLHFDRARIARRAGDQDAFQHHATAARDDLTTTHNPSAIARVNRLFDASRAPAASGNYVATEGYTAALRQLVDPSRRNKAQRVLQEIASTIQARSAQLFLVLYGKPVLCAQQGGGLFDTSFEPSLAKLAAKLDGEQSEPAISEVLAQVPTEFGRTGRILPLLVSQGGGTSQLVALVALGESECPDAVSELDLPLLAAELAELDGSTETVA